MCVSLGLDYNKYNLLYIIICMCLPVLSKPPYKSTHEHSYHAIYNNVCLYIINLTYYVIYTVQTAGETYIRLINLRRSRVFIPLI